MSVEYEIDRHFSVETSAGANLRPGIGPELEDRLLKPAAYF